MHTPRINVPNTREALTEAKNYWRLMAVTDKLKGNITGRRMSVDFALWYRERLKGVKS